MKNIKELLLEGCVISMPYKTKKRDWVGDVKIHIFNGYYSKPKIYIVGAVEVREYELNEIDNAIKDFEDLVFNPNNFQYKMCETICELNLAGNFKDLDNQKENNEVREIIKSKL